MATLLPIVLLLVTSMLSTTTTSGASDPPQKVTLTMYYESLCPACSFFTAKELKNIFSQGLISIVDLRLIPYGNANILDDGSIECQHGSDECLLNAVEACAINAWPDATEHFNFIHCIEEMVVDGTYTQWKTCFDKLGLDSNFVLNCASGSYGKHLEYEYGAATDALVPPHRFVPWVVVNGKPLDDVYTFETAVCEAYEGELPERCQDLLSEKKKKKQKQELQKLSLVNKEEDN